jgi:hypothetical protein
MSKSLLNILLQISKALVYSKIKSLFRKEYSFTFGLCLMSSLPKGERVGTKLVELFANRVDERRNMINDYLRGGACIESVRGSIDFELFVHLECLP